MVVTMDLSLSNPVLNCHGISNSYKSSNNPLHLETSWGLGLPLVVGLAHRLGDAGILAWCRDAASRVSGDRGLMCQCVLAFADHDRRRARRLLREVADDRSRDRLLATLGETSLLRKSFDPSGLPEEPVPRAREAARRGELLVACGADAGETLALAAGLASECGMVGLAEHVGRLRANGHHPAPGRALTRRELDVLRGVVDGLSDKEVAASLGIAKNAANILRKLGAPSRVAAARVAHVEHLLD